MRLPPAGGPAMTATASVRASRTAVREGLGWVKGFQIGAPIRPWRFGGAPGRGPPTPPAQDPPPHPPLRNPDPVLTHRGM